VQKKIAVTYMNFPEFFFLTYSKKNILELCRTSRFGTINMMKDNIFSEVSISSIKMTPNVKNNHLSTHRSVIWVIFVLLKLLDKQSFLCVLSGIIWPRFGKKVVCNIEVVTADHERSQRRTILQLVNGSEEITKLTSRKSSVN
jgi:hypothetical protein